MVYLYFCKACEEGKHGKCELGHSVPSGTYGGSICRCPCRGNAEWNTPEWIEKELQKAVQEIIDHQKASEDAVKNSILKVGEPPKKIHLKDP